MKNHVRILLLSMLLTALGIAETHAQERVIFSYSGTLSNFFTGPEFAPGSEDPSLEPGLRFDGEHLAVTATVLRYAVPSVLNNEYTYQTESGTMTVRGTVYNLSSFPLVWSNDYDAFSDVVHIGYYNQEIPAAPGFSFSVAGLINRNLFNPSTDFNLPLMSSVPATSDGFFTFSVDPNVYPRPPGVAVDYAYYYVTDGQFTSASAVPEPTTWSLVVLSSVGLYLVRNRRRVAAIRSM